MITSIYILTINSDPSYVLKTELITSSICKMEVIYFSVLPAQSNSACLELEQYIHNDPYKVYKHMHEASVTITRKDSELACTFLRSNRIPSFKNSNWIIPTEISEQLRFVQLNVSACLLTKRNSNTKLLQGQDSKRAKT